MYLDLVSASQVVNKKKRRQIPRMQEEIQRASVSENSRSANLAELRKDSKIFK